MMTKQGTSSLRVCLKKRLRSQVVETKQRLGSSSLFGVAVSRHQNLRRQANRTMKNENYKIAQIMRNKD